MGRPPIGKHAMTDAERQRRHRLQAIRARLAKIRKDRGLPTITDAPPEVTKPALSDEQIRKLAAIRARLAAIRKKHQAILEGIEAEGRKTKRAISPAKIAALGRKLRHLLKQLTGLS
jgi:hypothetical protein